MVLVLLVFSDTIKALMKAAIFDPYLDTVGGGERYMMSTASFLSEKGWSVDVQWRDPSIKDKIFERLGINLQKVNITHDGKNGKGYDLVFWLSDGSIPNLYGKKNILHFQTPFQNVGGASIFNKIKLRKIHKIICNSHFTKRFIDKEYHVFDKSVVIYPPVDVNTFETGRKENIILSVGRFSQLQQAKHQEVLIRVFKKMSDNGLSGWKLILTGGSDIGGREFVGKLKKSIDSYTIEILENLPFSKLKILYETAKIFWSASGFGVDEEKYPQKVEHFGIVTVEAMAGGCVPVVVGKGGHREIIEDGKNGFLWSTEEELQKITNHLITNRDTLEKIAGKARERSLNFSIQEFENKIEKTIF